ncbi:hypothetical protein Ct9H90mP29_04180 [bacterium]|nr:MAG: hypothetical protein Ct9H90mP29_04180 [bacterium]
MVFFQWRLFCKVNEITQLAEKHNAMVMVDDSHATGFIGNTGRGLLNTMV